MTPIEISIIYTCVINMLADGPIWVLGFSQAIPFP